MKKMFIFTVLLGLLLMGCLSTEPDTATTADSEAVERSFPGHANVEALQGPFENAPQVTAACLSCHEKQGHDFIKTVHWTWQGATPNMKGYENATTVGKVNTINNFCVAIESNWGRCTQCHAGYGWKDANFDFSKTGNIDCLVCHEQTGTYKKNPKTAGLPNAGTNLIAVAQSVGKPSRSNCGACHFFAGGGDNVKKGDLYTALANPDESLDVHMGRLDFSCQDCHTTENHNIRGSSLHIAVSSGKVSCSDCHQDPPHEDSQLNRHITSVACQTCHIPTFSRAMATTMFWDWSKAGEKDSEGREITRKREDGKPTYASKKGEFVWEKNVRPEYAWWDGTFNRMLLGDIYAETPVDLASPIGSIENKAALIYPFKVMRGIQGADPVYKRLLVGHLFGKVGGDNPYWAKWDWDLAFKEGMETSGIEYSGTYEWVETFMYMAINHEVAPKEQALSCTDCHNGGIDFTILGYQGDPWNVGSRG